MVLTGIPGGESIVLAISAHLELRREGGYVRIRDFEDAWPSTRRRDRRGDEYAVFTRKRPVKMIVPTG